MQRALDVSNYSGVFSTEVVAGWRQLGFTHLVCGTQRPAITRKQLEAALAGGMSIDAYVYLYWRFDVADQLRTALQTVAGLPVGWLWLDCEDAATGLAPEVVVSLIDEAVRACGERPHGIYTGRWWWGPATGDSTAFSHLPLWHAEYSSGPEFLPDFDGFRPYGGWTRPVMWQFQGTTQLCGVGVDLNVLDVEGATPVEAPATPPALSETERYELDVLRAGRRFLLAYAGGRYAFRPLTDRPTEVELFRIEDGEAVSLQPPCVLNVD